MKTCGTSHHYGCGTRRWRQATTAGDARQATTTSGDAVVGGVRWRVRSVKEESAIRERKNDGEEKESGGAAEEDRRWWLPLVFPATVTGDGNDILFSDKFFVSARWCWCGTSPASEVIVVDGWVRAQKTGSTGQMSASG
ncbi:hypothetical protein HanIR_Chr13g0622391 [Helianthus annuus]|nr:hypothetical protein HanIR_Chr13g0622391 [Helianthus annuus]